MDSFEINKIIISILLVALFVIGVNKLGDIVFEVEKPKASLYLWAKTPQKYSSKELATILLEEKAIVVTPGSSYGKYGEGFVRLSLTTTDENINKAIERLKSWKIPVK